MLVIRGPLNLTFSPEGEKGIAIISSAIHEHEDDFKSRNSCVQSSIRHTA